MSIPRNDSSSFWILSGEAGSPPLGGRNRHSPSFSMQVGSGAAVGSQRDSRNLAGEELGPAGVSGGEVRGQSRKTLASMSSGTFSGVSHLALVMLPCKAESTRVYVFLQCC